MSELVPLEAIEVRKRIRTIDKEIVSQLKASIRTKGLFHAPVIGKDPQVFLVAGEHRKAAMTELHAEGIEFFYNGTPVPKGLIPVVNVIDLDPADLLEAELEENVIRAPTPWQERAAALAAIHELRQKANPGQTFAATAKELAAKIGRDPTKNNASIRAEVKNAVLLANNMHRPSVQKARNATEALGILLKEDNAAVEAEIIRRRTAQAMAEPPAIVLHCGDMRLILPTFEPGIADLFIADLPYGIKADSGGFRSRTVEHHNYDDSPELAQELMQCTITEAFRVCKQRANLFVFGDVDLFPFFKRACASMGWTPFRTPVIWRKSDSEGLAPWGREGFRRTYEMLFFATKGQRGLVQSPVDILDEKRVGRSVRRYGPEKPIGLLKQLIEAATLPGDLVIDPCCGAGSTLAACRQTKRRAIGIELDKSAYNLAVVAAERDPEGSESETQSAEELA